MQANSKTTISIGASYLGVALSLSLNPAQLAGKYHDFEINFKSYGRRFGFDVSYTDAKNFEGWYYDGYLFNTNGRHSLAGIGTIENGSTIVLTARWSNKDRYFVSYLLDGGSFAGAPVNSFYAGDSATIATPTKTGYNFGGWVISGTTTTVTSFSDLTGDTILEAQWTEKTFDIIYDKKEQC